MDKGIIYIATGGDYQQECCVSAKSVKEKMPDIPITVFTDKYFDCEHINNIEILDNPSYSSSDSIKNLLKSPYEKTIYFDTDIYVEDDVTGIFQLVNDHDLAIVIDPLHSNHSEKQDFSIPEDYPLYNTGVIAFNNNERTAELFTNWLDIFESQTNTVFDQPSFRTALYYSDVRSVTLPPEYNCLYGTCPGYLSGSVKIFHGRLANVNGYKGLSYNFDPEKVRNNLNSTSDPRVYLPSRGFQILTKPDTTYERISSSLQKNGIIKTFYLGIRELLIGK